MSPSSVVGSLMAGVSARIAEASFMRTMWQALKLCLPITVMTFGIFVRCRLVVKPGWGMIVDMLLVAMACWGITFSIFGRIALSRGSNMMLRAALALVSFVVMFHPDGIFHFSSEFCLLDCSKTQNSLLMTHHWFQSPGRTMIFIFWPFSGGPYRLADPPRSDGRMISTWLSCAQEGQMIRSFRVASVNSTSIR
jgi:hypothetical protein